MSLLKLLWFLPVRKSIYSVLTEIVENKDHGTVFQALFGSFILRFCDFSVKKGSPENKASLEKSFIFFSFGAVVLRLLFLCNLEPEFIKLLSQSFWIGNELYS